MKLTKRNYYSDKSNLEYMSVSQFKEFQRCEAAAMAQLRGEYIRPKTTALLVGSYVDAWFEGTLDQFRADNPEIFKRDGSLKSEYIHAEHIIERIKQDNLFMELMGGRKQVIRTGEICGVPFKIKMDSYKRGKAIVDLKIVRDFAPIWVPGQGKLNFIETWGYDLQGAAYQAIEGNHLPFIIAAATKEPEPDIGVWEIDQAHLNAAMEEIESNIQRYAMLKLGIGEPVRCERCDYCKRTKKLNIIQNMEELDNYE